jgi:hypothetical protein
MEQQLCVFACNAFGETGALIIALLGFIFGLWQRRAKVATDATAKQLEQANVQLQAKVESLSLRPPALPVILTPQGTLAIPSLTPPSSSNTPSLETPPYSAPQNTPAPAAPTPADNDEPPDTHLD